MIIRDERPEEFPAIHTLVETAFQTARVSDGTEQDFVDTLRAGQGYIPDLALVAEKNGALLGHIMLTETHVNTGRTRAKALLLAPLSVVLEERGKGIGARLVKKALQRAREKGYPAVFLVGDSAYYGQFGFQQAALYGVSYPGDVPEQYVLARELYPKALLGMRGTLDAH